MATAVFYNGTDLSAYTGSTGIIVSQLQHDSSPEVELTATPRARANGALFQQLRSRSKRISLTGTIQGSSSSDLEQRIDNLKNLFSVREGELKVANYGTLEYRVAIMEEGESWSGHSAYNFTNYSIGTRSLSLAATTTPDVANWAATHDLSTFAADDTFKLWADISNASLLANVKVRFETATGTDYFEKSWTSGFSTGANTLTVTRSSMTTAGSPSWSNITNIQFIVTGNSGSTVTVSLDDLRIVTTSESRLYTVSMDSELSILREHYNIDWADFSVSLTCVDGVGRSDKIVRTTYPATTKNARNIVRYLSGSGPQYPALHVTPSAMHPISISDHYVDDFSSYADAAAAGNALSLTGSWAIAAYKGYITALTETTGSGTVSATLRNVTARDGDLIALVYVSGTDNPSVGLVGRASSATSPLSGSYVKGRYLYNGSNDTATLSDSQSLSLSMVGGTFYNPTFTVSGWLWLKLSLRGNVVEFSYREVQDDVWTSLFRTTTSVTSAGSWGIVGEASDMQCAHLEFVDASSESSNTLLVQPSYNATFGVAVDPKGLTAASSGAQSAVTGAYPSLSPGLSRISMHQPNSYLGADHFFSLPALMDAKKTIKRLSSPSTNDKVAILFSTGANTGIRQRGSYVYLAKGMIDNFLRATIQTTSGGLPTGTPALDITTNPALAEFSSIPGTLTTTSTEWNSSIQPYEIVWDADIVLSASTPYALVFEFTTAGQTAYVPCASTAVSGSLAMATYSGGSWSAATTGGFLLLAGNDTDDASWTHAITYSPTYL